MTFLSFRSFRYPRIPQVSNPDKQRPCSSESRNIPPLHPCVLGLWYSKTTKVSMEILRVFSHFATIVYASDYLPCKILLQNVNSLYFLLFYFPIIIYISNRIHVIVSTFHTIATKHLPDNSDKNARYPYSANQTHPPSPPQTGW